MNGSGFDQCLKKKILQRTALFCLLLTLVNSLGLKLFFSYEVDGNAFYGSFSVLIESVIRFFEIIAFYVGYAAMVWSLFRFGPAETMPFALVSAGCMLLSLLCSLVISYFCTTPALFASNFMWFLGQLLLNLVLNLVALGLIWLAAAAVRYHALKKGKNDYSLGVRLFALRLPVPRAFFYTSLLCVLVSLVQDVYQTVVDLTTYGAPVNMTELVYLVRPYAEALIYFFVGYCVLFASGALFEHWDERKEERT